MARMMETLESRQMFSVTTADPAALPADSTSTTDVGTTEVDLARKAGSANTSGTEFLTWHFATVFSSK